MTPARSGGPGPARLRAPDRRAAPVHARRGPGAALRRMLLAVTCGLVLASGAHAHLLNMTRVTLALDPDGEGSLEVEIDLGQSLLSPEDYVALARASSERRDAALAPVLARLEEGLGLVADGAPLPRAFEDAVLVAESLAAVRNPLTPQMATLRWRLPATDAEAIEIRLADELDVPWPCLVRVDSTRRELPVSRLLTEDRRDSGAVALRDGGARDASRDGLGTLVGVYGWLGIEHIVPKGLDHVLFILGLFLVGGAFRELLILVSCFTLAHTVTLGAATLGVIALPATIVEPLIAASIVYVGVEALFGGVLPRARAPTVFAFGLLHGLGFASVLREIGLPDDRFLLALLSFNGGVEIGQLLVLAAAFAVLGGLHRRPWYGACIVQPGAMLVAGVGVYWLLQRI
ncbi:MAG: HupE/UreJ family protein [Pseudomonadales bacterium]|jgi:hypothetical protein|nr:HupE/UreJ family protein [Pseudomonadales bacterium]